MREFKIVAFDAYDGDSVSLTLDLGFDLVFHTKARIDGIDTPELRGGTAESKAAGYLARDEARKFIAAAMADGGATFLSTTYRGKYGRPLGDVRRERDGQLLTAFLLNEHLAVPYHGEAKTILAVAHAENLHALRAAGRIRG